MPIIRLPYKYLEKLTGTDRETIINRMPMIGADIERIEEDHIDVEFFPDRPDLFSTEGVARAMQGFLGLKEGINEYPVTPSGISFRIDPGLTEIRPFLGSAVIRNVSLNEEAIESLMGLQEALHWAIGRGRGKVAIGVHDLDTVTPPFYYQASPRDRAFVPLDFDEEMTLEEILDRHPKGVDYAHLVRDYDRFPLITDAEDHVLSFPPIINGERTKVTTATKNILLDCTGTNEKAVMTAVNNICTALADAGATIESVEVEGAPMPSLAPAVRTVSVDECCRLLGISLTAEEMCAHLRAMRFGAEPEGQGKVRVSVPCYRADIMHDWDIFEDVGISYGFENFDSALPESFTIGKPHPVMVLLGGVREILAGLGFLEMMPFTLTNERVLYTAMQRDPNPGVLRLQRPISEEQTVMRTDILPMLVETLQNNHHRELPQRLFAIGDCVEEKETFQKVAMVSIHSDADFSEIYACADALMREMHIAYEVRESEDPAFIPGRRADIMVNGKKAGVFGELSPDVIQAFELEAPICAMECDLRCVQKRPGL